jgi:hypothetical protein
MAQVPQGDDRPIGAIITGLGSEEVLARLASAGINTVGNLRDVNLSHFFAGRELGDVQRLLSFEARA